MGRRVNLKHIHVPYWKWECYKSGMWAKVDKKTEARMLQMAIDFTGDHVSYGKAMVEVSDKWKYSMINFLTNKSVNRKAHIGHCAVFYKLQIPEYITRKAWKQLTEKQRILANLEADKAIKRWELKRRSYSTSRSGSVNATKTEYQMSLQLK